MRLAQGGGGQRVGAGVASSIVSMLGFFALVLFLRRDARSRLFALFQDVAKPDWARLKDVVRLGWPIGVAIAFEGMLFNACVFLMGRIGVNEVAAYQLALNVASIAFMAPLGLSMAGGVRVGLAAGAGDWPRVRRAAALTIGLAIAAIMIVAAPVMAFPGAVAGFYLDRGDPANADVLALVTKFLVIAGAFMLFDATQVSSAQALRGLKDVRAPMIITGLAYWAVGFPAAAYLGLKAATLNKWRVFGDGPPFIKVGHLVRYRKADLDAFLQSRLRRSTSDAGDG